MYKITVKGQKKGLVLLVDKSALAALKLSFPSVVSEEALLRRLTMAIYVSIGQEIKPDEVIKLGATLFIDQSCEIEYQLKSENYATSHRIFDANMPTEKDLETSSSAINVELLEDNHPDCLDCICKQQLPPIDSMSSQIERSVPDHNATRSFIRHYLNTKADVPYEQAVVSAKDFDAIVSKLRDIREAELGAIPQNISKELAERIRALDLRIANDGRDHEKVVNNLHEAIYSYLKAQYDWDRLVDRLLIVLYNAAKKYYLQILKECHHKKADLDARILELNATFKGIAVVKGDYSISPIEDCKDLFKGKTIEDINIFVNALVSASYTNNWTLTAFVDKGFDSIKEMFALDAKQNNADEKSPLLKSVYRQKKAMKHAKKFSEQFTQTYLAHIKADVACTKDCADDNFGLLSMLRLIEDLKDAVSKEAAEIKVALTPMKKSKKAAQQPVRAAAANTEPGFFKRNAATFVAVGIGIAVAAGVGAVIALFATTWPFWAVCASIAGIAVLCIVAGAVIGRMIDGLRKDKRALVVIHQPVADPFFSTDAYIQQQTAEQRKAPAPVASDSSSNSQHPHTETTQSYADIRKEVDATLGAIDAVGEANSYGQDSERFYVVAKPQDGSNHQSSVPGNGRNSNHN